MTNDCRLTRPAAMVPTRYLYHFGGFRIDSATPIAGLRPAAEPGPAMPAIAVEVSAQAPPQPERHMFSWPGRYGLQLGMIDKRWLMWSAFDGVFVIDMAMATVTVHASRFPLAQGAVDVLVRRILPRLVCLLAESLPIHAAGVSDGERGHLLIGRSGAGKSTLAAACAHLRGWSIYSDDISVLGCETIPQLTPSTTGVCIWPATRAGLAIDLAQCSAMGGYDGKLHWQPGAIVAERPVPLASAIFLERVNDADEPPRLDRMPVRTALIGAGEQIIRFNPGATEPGEAALQTLRFLKVLERIPAYRLSYGSGYHNLPAVIDVISSG